MSVMEKEEKKTQEDWVVAISLQTYSCNKQGAQDEDDDQNDREGG